MTAGPAGGPPSGDPTGDPTGPPPPPEFKPPASQEEFNATVEKRLGQQRRQYGIGDMTPDQVAARLERADAMDALELELASDADKQARAAADAAYSAAIAQAVPRIVMAEFKAEAKGVLTDEQAKGLLEFLEDVDMTRYANDDGEPDIEKIRGRVASFATPAGSGPTGPTTRTTTLGQGNRTPGKASSRDAGHAEAERRYGPREKTTA